MNDIAPYVTLTAFFAFAGLAGFVAYKAALSGARRYIKQSFDDHLAAMHSSKEKLVEEIREDISTAINATKD